MNERELRAAAGRVLVGGFPGETLHGDFRGLVEEGLVGGAILFARNLRGLEHAASLVSELRALASPLGAPLLVSIDQEGGRVQRLRAPFPELPPMRSVGDLGRKSVARRAGVLIGECLAMAGFTQNYAPVLDVDSNPDNPVIGDRSFSRDPSAVARLGAAYIDGLQSAGVAACGKHFPGHGDTSKDSHLELPTLPHGRERLEAIELVPFRAAVRAGVASIMTAHVLFPALDPAHPATLSEHVIEALLRRGMGFDGVIVSDDLEMKAVADHYGVEDAAIRAIRAGCDQLLICHQPELVRRAHQALVAAALDGTLPAARLMEAAARVDRLKSAFPGSVVRPSPEVLPAALPLDRHRSLLDALAGREVMIASTDGVPEYDFEGDPDDVPELDA